MLEAYVNIPLAIGQENFILLPERAVFWTEEKVLFCSDLHWGRERYLQSQGFAVPEVSFATEARIIAELVSRYSPSEIWILGDFIHHPRAVEATFRKQIADWAASLAPIKITLIPGNHDRGVNHWLPECGIRIATKGIERKGITFSHEEREGATGFHWYGHLHPSVRIPGVSGNRKLPCFFVRKDRAYLPAFSRLAGGAELGKLHATDRIYAIYENLIFQQPTTSSSG